MHRTEFDHFSLALPSDWEDITEATGTGTLSLAAKEGTGALQFTVGTWLAGPMPRASVGMLQEMLDTFAESNALASARDRCVEEADLRLVAATYASDDAMVRVWFVSDGANFAQITFLAVSDDLPTAELADAESIVRSLVWPPLA